MTMQDPTVHAATEVASLYLPPEILLMIIECLGVSFFQENIGRLALFKRWYSLSLATFFTNIRYTPRVLSRLVNCKGKKLDRSRAMLKKTLRSVNIVLEGIGPGSDPSVRCFDTASNLCCFGLMLMAFPELRSVSYSAKWANRGWKGDPLQFDYLPLRSIKPYLILPHLKFLDLDLCGTAIKNQEGGLVHFCPFIQPLLSKLEGLRLKMRRICMDAVSINEDQTVTVKDLTINLYLGEVSNENPKLNSAMCCFSPKPWYWSSPIDELRHELKALAIRMPQPQCARIIHLTPSGWVHTWNSREDRCVTERTERKRSFPLLENWDKGECFSRRTGASSCGH
ncbi:hypothetical protein B0H63DRAFT_157345 [Podospora didyma]|uniref:Uncharacterized protein n=1 Tax=Podospora didyma TaxID=330526 RepID=A0AAE0U1H0_9PEZI|nr:hypothetical protein B0H63DRAFT_157345 [Podospora didyma]